jgi:hypothetical protein
MGIEGDQGLGMIGKIGKEKIMVYGKGFSVILQLNT